MIRFTLLLISAVATCAFAQQSPFPSERGKPDQAAAATPNPAIREVSPGHFEVGDVKLDQKARTISFPGAINMDRGLLEYLIVGRNGPTHESLLVTDARAVDIHTAMLLLGVKPTQQMKLGAPPAQLTNDYLKTAPKLQGDLVSITATWKDKDGVEKTTEVSDWLTFFPTKKPPERGPWTYTGSLLSKEGRFLAELEDIIAGLVTNPSALINNPRKGSDDDRDWEVNEKDVPKSETKLTIAIRLLEAEKK